MQPQEDLKFIFPHVSVFVLSFEFLFAFFSIAFSFVFKQSLNEKCKTTRRKFSFRKYANFDCSWIDAWFETQCRRINWFILLKLTSFLKRVISDSDLDSNSQQFFTYHIFSVTKTLECPFFLGRQRSVNITLLLKMRWAVCSEI